jgi:2-oxoacid:acceptor oxidoreductase gamma subunit (pyruvate/2-ketoisovalerate family)
MAKEYIEIRFHGRGGQGIVTASALLSQAFFNEGRYPQSVPLYGPQRRGAPVTVFLRAGDCAIRLRSGVYDPNFVLVLDDSLVQIANVTHGVPEGGMILVNTPHTNQEDLGLCSRFRVAGIDADEIAYRMGLGGPPYPRINTLMLAAFSRVTGLVSLRALIQAAMHRFPSGDRRLESSMQEAHERTRWL